MPETKIVKFVDYKRIFNHVEKSGIVLPLSYLNSDENIDELISGLINDLEIVEAISFSSFLNAVVQTSTVDEIQHTGWSHLRHCKLTQEKQNDGVVFHRDNLLHIIGKFIEKDNVGSKKITGQKTYENAADYIKALLLISQKEVFRPSTDMAKQVLLKDTILRAYPYYYFPDTVEQIYRIRLQRYWHIYDDLIETFEAGKVDKIKTGISNFAESYSLSLNEYFHVLTGVFAWFYQTRLVREAQPDNEKAKKLGFNHENIDSYYIRKRNFGEDNNTFNLIGDLSTDLESLKAKIRSSRPNQIEGFYKDFQTFFDCPIYKIDDDNYCIIDLKFLFEGVCSGLMWKIQQNASIEVPEIKEQYGYLLERYFTNLLKKIFGETLIKTDEGEGEPDAILETDDYILVFEFTTEYYRLGSLYSEDAESFKEDVYRILFNTGKDDPLARGKKDKGKFHKLNTYVEKQLHKNKTIIPILVTENNLGDSTLLDGFEDCISENIQSQKLSNLTENVPLILNLDDLEMFWRLSTKSTAQEQFIEFINQWRKIAERGPYHFNFSYFISELHDQKDTDNDFNEFFKWGDFIDKLKGTTAKKKMLLNRLQLILKVIIQKSVTE